MGKTTTENYKSNAREEGKISSWPEEKNARMGREFPHRVTSLSLCPVMPPLGQGVASHSGQGLSLPLPCLFLFLILRS